MSEERSAPATVLRPDVRAGPLLAEGGEGRVYELAGQPGVLYKAYRRPTGRAALEALIQWRDALSDLRPELAHRVDASAAWPTALVAEPGAPGDTVAGLLLPRAPRRFSLRHRDGRTRLATLSYLTTDPGQRAAAYGLALPAPLSVERIGIVYALARLLEAFQAATPALGHGDLSTKNVLWSLERGPEVFVLDCDSCERYGPDSVALDSGHRRRAMTPNWDDPAIPAGSNPTLASDRYSLALIFLRVVGAAHFPIQGRQRQGERLTIDFGVPPSARRARSLGADAAIWEVCARSLSTDDPVGRPGASAWVGALEQVLGDLGAMNLVRTVWAAQGGGSPAPTPAAGAPRPDPDVTVRPVASATRTQRWERVAPASGPGAPWRGRGSAPGTGGAVAGAVVMRAAAPAGTRPASGQAGSVAVSPVSSQFRAGLRRAASAWLRFHRRMTTALASRRRRRTGVRLLAACVALDFVLLVGVAFVVAMLVSPWLGI